MRWARVLVAPVVLSTIAAVGCKGKPETAADWAEQIKDARKLEEKLEAIKTLRRMKDKVAVPALSEALADLKLREEAAFTLGEIGDPSAVPALMEAIDFSAAGGDEESRMGVKANGRIAGALGLLGDTKAVPALVKLLKNRDAVTRVAAVNALKDLGDKGAVGPLSEVATNTSEETFVNKMAIIALGELADPAGLPAVVKMLFHERRGVSFYAESSFSAFQIGPAAVEPMLKVLKGEDKELAKWADENGVKKAALYIKSAGLLGDLGDARAVPALIQKLKYEDELFDMQLLVRNFAASALGRLFAKEAAAPISAMLEAEEEANVRQGYASTLVIIGDRAALPKMLSAAKVGSWDARSVTIAAITQLGDEREVPAIEALAKFEKDKGMPICMENEQEGEDKAAREKRCASTIDERQKWVRNQVVRLTAAKECKKDQACWLGKLKDPEWRVRERAAFELGRMGDAKALPALLAAIGEEQLEVRYAVIISVEKLAPKDTATAKAAAPAMVAQLEREKGKAHFVKINEDLRRLQIKVARL